MAKKKDITSNTSNTLTKEYVQTLSDIKKEIEKAQIEAAVSANEILIRLYWSIGKKIEEKQKAHNWGSSFLGIGSENPRL